MRYVIFGTGKFSNAVLENISINDIECFIDNDKQKHNITIKGKKVYSLEDFIERSIVYDKIFIASVSYFEISEQLSSYGLVAGRDFYDGIELLTNTEIRNCYGMGVNIDDEFINIYKKCKTYSMTDWKKMHAVYEATKYIVKNNIQGDFVECGVWRGGNPMVMAETLMLLNEKKRNIYLFDTYEGMSEPIKGTDIGFNNGEEAHNTWLKMENSSHNDWCYASLEDVKLNMKKTNYPQNFIHFIKGDVLETLPKNKIEKISLLRIDTDWYESTKASLEYLYPNLENNGILIEDDYLNWTGAKKAVDEYFEKIKAYPFKYFIGIGSILLIKTY